MQLFLFPGLDGTGKLLRDFCNAISAAPTSARDYDATILPLPINVSNTYASLTDHFSTKIFRPFATEKYVLIAESFSGPLAVKLADRHPDRIAAIVLVATFCWRPSIAGCRLLPWRLLFRLPLPSAVARYGLLGPHADDMLVEQLRDTVQTVPANLLAQRMREVLRVDVRTALAGSSAPTLYVRPTCDRLVRMKSSRLVMTTNPAVQEVSIAGPHLILQTQPRACWDQIQPFLDTC